MIPDYLSAVWRAFAPAFGNHLWQSTLFAITAGLLTFILRKNQARIRYWLWLAASMKFLIPFSLLVGIGSLLTWPQHPARTNAGFYIAMEEVSQPFTQPTISVIPQGTAPTGLIYLLPAILAAVWLCGFLAVVFVWHRRWRRVSASLREAEPVREGRELQALRRLKRTGGMSKPIAIYLSRTSLEPGIFGIAQPVLIWPQGISERLEDAHLEAILAHELWHVRRRDNLASALHMLVEAVFWFHPLVWWLGSRLVEERERACDEAVLESGSDRQVYAESILKICEFCVESPLACVSGVTGADLKKRMVHIMTKQVARELDFSRKLLLTAAAVVAVAAPVTSGLLDATSSRAGSQAQNSASGTPVYEVASVKLNKAGTSALKTGGIVSQRVNRGPGTFTAENISMWELIRLAYRVEDYQVSGAPDWFSSDLYDIDAKAEKSAIGEIQNFGDDQRELQNRRMLQTLLKDRFNLTLRQMTKDLPVYSLVVADAGKLHEAQGECAPGPHTMELGTSSPPPCGSLRVFPWVGHMDGVKVPIAQLVANLSGFTKRMVLDNTSLGGKYDISLKWFPGPGEFPTRPAYLPATYQPDPRSPPLLMAIQQQLGLKLEPQTGPVPLLVIDHAEQPSEPQAKNTAAVAPGFKVASVKLNNSITQDNILNVPPGPEDVYFPNGGQFSGTNVRLISYIYFAYNLAGSQFQLLMPQLPKWVVSDHFDIQAQAEGNPNKAQMRLLMQSLLADRFKLVTHYETQQLPVFALVSAKPGESGPQLHPHRGNSSCSPQTSTGSAAAPPAMVAGGFPAVCGSIVGMPSSLSGRLRVGARDVPIGLLATTLAQMGNLDRPVLDRTGLSGTFDFTFEWAPQHNGPGTPGAKVKLDESGATFLEDLKDQLGLRLESQTGPTEILVIDHVEKPSAN